MTTLGTAPWAMRRWRRMERRAIAEYERELLASLRALGAAATPVVALQAVAGRAGTVVCLVLPQHRLTLAGVAAGAAGDARVATAVRACGRGLTLQAGGRYGPWWWLTAACGEEPLTLLGSHLRLVADPGPPGAGPRPSGWDTPSARAYESDGPSHDGPCHGGADPGTPIDQRTLEAALRI